MGLKSFLKQQGFIAGEPGDKIKEKGDHSNAAQQPASTIAPTFFPLHSATNETATSASSGTSSPDPSFVTPLHQNTTVKEQLDPTFVKFFEDELVKANLPGPDYFEFRQQLTKTQQKMAAKGVAAPEVVLQAVLMNFETQDISTAKLIDAARHYKEIIQQKNDDFLKGASSEKNNQLQKRQTVLESHNDTIKKIQQQIQQLEIQKQQLGESLNREKTQMDVDRSLGKEGIEKIEKAERLISSAHDYIQSTIDTDIKSLQSV
ncbi:MAG: hypothetical protein ABI707_18250 [Ferruginibacter sp.]